MPLLARLVLPRLVLIGFCLAAGAITPGYADRDHDSARRAVEHGEALPLADILARVRPQLGGEVVGVAFERERGRWIYEFRVIGPSGRLAEVHVDATTGQVIARGSD